MIIIKILDAKIKLDTWQKKHRAYFSGYRHRHRLAAAAPLARRRTHLPKPYKYTDTTERTVKKRRKKNRTNLKMKWQLLTQGPT